MSERPAPTGVVRDLPAAWHLILFALSVALPLLLLVGVLLYRSVTLERQQHERQIVRLMENLVDDVDRDIDRHMTVLRTLATSPALAAQDWAGLHAQATKGLTSKGYLILIDATGRQLVNTYVPYGQAPEFTGDPATLEFMRRTRQPVVSDLFVSLVARKPVYNISIPILRNGGGELEYVMSLGLLPDDLFALLEANKLEPGWTATIIDRKGVILARSRDHDRRVGTPVRADRLTQAPGVVFASTNLEGAPVLAVTGRSSLSGWTVSTSYPAELIEQRMRRSLWLWGATIASVAALVVLLAALFGRELTGPLAAATAAAAALGRGLPVRVRNSRLREANAVNQALKDAQDELQRRSAALRESEEQLRDAADAAQFGAHQYDVVHDRVIRSAQLRRILGADEASDATFKSALSFVHPDDRYEVERRKLQIVASERDYQLTYRIRRPGGDVRWVMDRGRVVRDEAGAALRVVGVLLDITDLKAAEQRQRLLFDELNHRVKNTLAIVQSLAQQTLRSKPDPAEFARAFEDRLASLARAHNLLTRDSWQGADLGRIVSSALEPFAGVGGGAGERDDGERVRASGPAIAVPAGSTITLCLMLHELATNAAKYGALSVPGGRVQIDWTVLSESGPLASIELHWREENGPPIAAPIRKGFGSRLLAASALQLNAEFEIDYRPAGLACRLRFAVPQRQSPAELGSLAAG
jgi:PAS domain S-box-containing protein